MVVLSSFYTYVIRFFLVMVIILNLIGILVIRYFISKDKSITYDISQNFAFIFVCVILLYVSSRLVSAKFDKKRNVLVVKRFLGNNFIIESKEILNIENVSLFICKLVYTKNDVKKSISFIPNLALFIPLSNYPDEMKKILKVKR